MGAARAPKRRAAYLIITTVLLSVQTLILDLIPFRSHVDGYNLKRNQEQVVHERHKVGKVSRVCVRGDVWFARSLESKRESS